MRKTPRPCRYCGHVCLTHRREGKGGAAASVASWSCRDVVACGGRLRSQTMRQTGRLPLPLVDDLPF